MNKSCAYSYSSTTLQTRTGLRWFDFGTNLELKEVVVGAQCGPKDIEAVKDVLKGYGGAVECSWAYMRKDAFLLVRHDFMPPWFSPPA
jgi:hypothetical protein